MENKIEAVFMLVIALTIDLIGMCSFAVPGLGESFDVVWAPIRKFIYIFQWIFNWKNL